MEDTVAVELEFLTKDSREYDFIAVYDGHGGSRVARACSERLHWLLEKEIEKEGAVSTASLDWDKVMATCFEKMDEEVKDNATAGVASAALSDTVGSTAVEGSVVNCGNKCGSWESELFGIYSWRDP